jgi:predicted nucleotidyltransferase
MGMKILTHLAANPGREFYQREIARETDVSAGAVNQYLRAYAEEGIVLSRKRGRMFFYFLNMDNPAVRQFKVFLTVSELNPLIAKIKEASDKIILFGSSSEGTDYEGSDIDLFILTSEKENVKKELSGFKSTKKLSPLILNSNELVKLKQDDKPLYERIMRGRELWKKK